MTNRARGTHQVADARRSPAGGGSVRVRGAVTALTVALFLGALDQSLFATALPTVAGAVGAGEHLFWISTATVLAGTVVMPVLGRLGDDIGRPRVLLGALAVLLAGSVVGGLAHNLPTLLTARVLQGLGGGGLLVLVEALVGDLVPPRGRTWTLSVVGSAFAVASVVGPVLGGLLTQTVGWRWAFWLNLPLGAVAVLGVTRLVPRQRGAGGREVVPLVRSLTPLAVAVVGLTLSVSWLAPGERPTLGVQLAVVAITTVAAWAWLRSDRGADRPLVPLSLFRIRNYALAVAAGFLVAVSLFGTVAYLPTYLQLGAGLSPGPAGLTMLGMVAGLGSATVVSARIVKRTGRYRALTVSGAVVGCLALATLAVGLSRSDLVVIGAGLVLLGIGIGGVWEVLVVVAQNVAPTDQLGVATAGNGFVREVGVLVGTAGVGAWYAASVGTVLAGEPGDSGWSSLTPERLAELPTATAQAVRGAYTEALVPIMATLIPFVGMAALLLLLLRPIRLGNRAPAESA